MSPATRLISFWGTTKAMAKEPLQRFETTRDMMEALDEAVGSRISQRPIALQQTAGKGQWGHSWVSATGGLYLSVGLDLDLKIVHEQTVKQGVQYGYQD